MEKWWQADRWLFRLCRRRNQLSFILYTIYTMTFLQNDYEAPVQESNYVKIKDGQTIKFRILSDSITGWVDWKDSKPIRTKTKPEKNVDDTKPAKHFWAFIIWDYEAGRCKVMEITQATIQKAIFELYKDSDRGEPTGYDLKVSRKKEWEMVKYSVLPSNKWEASKEVLEAFFNANPQLELLFEWGHPLGS